LTIICYISILINERAKHPPIKDYYINIKLRDRLEYIKPKITDSNTNHWISKEGYWHCNKNWSLGHVPLEYEDVIFYGITICYIHGDVNIRDLIVCGDSNVKLNVGNYHCSILARSLTIGEGSFVDFSNANVSLTGRFNGN
jgi:hypothetical protein